MENKAFLTVEEVAAEMGVSKSYAYKIIKKLNEAGTTILLVEQNAQMALSIADRAYVLETGKISLSGPASELLHNDSVRKAYLGE